MSYGNPRAAARAVFPLHGSSLLIFVCNVNHSSLSLSLLTMANGGPNKRCAEKPPRPGKSKETSKVCKKMDVVARLTPKPRPAVCAATPVGRASTRDAAGASRPHMRATLLLLLLLQRSHLTLPVSLM